MSLDYAIKKQSRIIEELSHNYSDLIKFHGGGKKKTNQKNLPTDLKGLRTLLCTKKSEKWSIHVGSFVKLSSSLLNALQLGKAVMTK